MEPIDEPEGGAAGALPSWGLGGKRGVNGQVQWILGDSGESGPRTTLNGVLLWCDYYGKIQVDK